MVLTIILSFKNEEGNIPLLIERLHRAIKPLKISYELLFINDASTDGSLDVLMSAAKKDRTIRVVNLSRNFGVAASKFAGFAYAQGSAIVIMDTDLQDPPEVIPEMFQRFREGAEVVHTTRLSRSGESRIRKLLTQLAYRMVGSIAEVRLPVESGDFKLVSRRVAQLILTCKETDPYIRGIITWMGFKQSYVYYHREPRATGKTHFPLLGLGPAKEFLRGITGFSVFPLYLPLVIGLGMLLVSSLMGGYWVIDSLRTNNWSSSLGWGTILLFLSGLHFFFLGIFGIYLAKMHRDSRNRPAYIVSDTIGYESHERGLPEVNA